MCLKCKNKILECIEELCLSVTTKEHTPNILALLTTTDELNARQILDVTNASLAEILLQLQRGKINKNNKTGPARDITPQTNPRSYVEQISFSILMNWLLKALTLLFVGTPCSGMAPDSEEQRRLLSSLIRIKAVETMTTVVLAALIKTYKKWNYGDLPETSQSDNFEDSVLATVEIAACYGGGQEFRQHQFARWKTDFVMKCFRGDLGVDYWDGSCRLCWNCDGPTLRGASRKVCSGCKFAVYCSPTCFETDWKFCHKKVCKCLRKHKHSLSEMGNSDCFYNSPATVYSTYYKWKSGMSRWRPHISNGNQAYQHFASFVKKLESKEQPLPFNSSVLVIGGAGQVGAGICHAFQKKKWTVISIDPLINTTIQQVSSDQFQSWMNTITQIVYVAEQGDREAYNTNAELSNENNARFTTFIERISNCCDSTFKSKITVHYVGGSWTRRQPSTSGMVSDEALCKDNGGDNNYEQAKTMAQQNASSLSTIHAISILFYDWISVVPNLNSNHTIAKMVDSAIKTNSITYSSEEYGRPLMHGNQSGEVVVAMARQRLVDDVSIVTEEEMVAKISQTDLYINDPDALELDLCNARKLQNGLYTFYMEHVPKSKYSNLELPLFATVLVPGCFVPFATFATIVKNIVDENQSSSGVVIELKEQETPTPIYLKTKCESLFVCNDLQISPDVKLIEDGIKESAMFRYKEAMKGETKE